MASRFQTLLDPSALNEPCRRAGNRLAARMHDVSQTGIRIETAHDLALGVALCVDIDFIGSKRAIVAWRRGTLYGCEFTTPLRHSDAARAMTGSPTIRLVERRVAGPWPLVAAALVLATSALGSWMSLPLS